MRVGSIVEVVGNFEESRLVWGLPYPKKGEVLTVSFVTEHPTPNVRNKGIVLLTFEELPNMIGICSMTFDGKPNFVELLLSDCIWKLLEEPIKQEKYLEVV